jgi:hypothetical protein
MKAPCKSDLQIDMERLAKDISSRWGSRSIQYAGALLSLAKIQSRDGFHGVAEGNLKVAISIADDHPEAGERKGIEARAELGCLYQALGRNAEAVQLLESAARLSAQLDSATASRVLQALGLGYIVRNCPRSSAGALGESSRSKPTLVGRTGGLGITVRRRCTCWRLSTLGALTAKKVSSGIAVAL